MIVRLERDPDDLAGVFEVHRSAFAAQAEAEGQAEVFEPRLVEQLRGDPGWDPRLSFVAESDTSPSSTAVIGHVCLTRGDLAGRPVLGLGPIGVLPAEQGRGVGSALLYAALGAAEALGEPGVALLGSADYYGRFGFVPAADLGVESGFPEWGEHFQVRPLTAWSPDLRGLFRYPAPFGVTPNV